MAKKSKKNLNVPNLRFPGFEGEWSKHTLEQLCNKIGDGLHGTPIYEIGTGYYFINGNNLVNGTISLSENVKEVTNADFIKNNKNLSENSILLSINGTIGNVSRYANQNVMLGKSIAYLDFKSNKDFFYHLLSSSVIQNHFISELTGSTIKNLSLKTIRETQIYCPSFTEKERTAKFLNAIDHRIQTQNKIIDLLETLIKKLGEDIFNQKMRFRGFDERWVKTTIKEQCIINPNTGPLENEFVYIDLELVIKGDLNKEVIVQRSEAPSRASRVLDDWDILFQCVRPYQRNNYLYRKKDDKQWVASTGYAQIKTHNNPSFIYYLINQSDFNEQVMMRCTGTSYPAISGSELAKIPISICSQQEQDKIASLLSTLNEKIRIERQLLARLKTQKKYLLQNLFV